MPEFRRIGRSGASAASGIAAAPVGTRSGARSGAGTWSLNPATFFGQIASRCGRIPTRDGVGGGGSVMARTRHQIIGASVSRIYFAYPNFKVLQGSTWTDAGSGHAMTIKAGVEKVGGSIFQATFASGATSGTIADASIGWGMCDVNLNDGDEFFMRPLVSVASGSLPVSDTKYNPSQGEAMMGTSTDLTLSGTITDDGAAGANTFPGSIYPCAIVGLTSAQSLLLISDSRHWGFADSISGSEQAQGEIERSFGGQRAILNLAINGDSATSLISRSSIRSQLYQWCTTVISDHSANQLGDSLSSWKTQIAALKTAVSPRKFGMTTAPPISGSTNNWTAADGSDQQPNANAQNIIDRNAYILAGGATEFDFGLDMATPVTLAADLRFWRGPGLCADGIHSTRAGYLAQAAAQNVAQILTASYATYMPSSPPTL